MGLFAGEFRRFFVAAGIVLFLAVAMVAIATAASVKKVSAGAVIAWSGTVYIERADGSKVKVERQETVYAGDTVLTEKSSRAKLLMKDDTVMLLASDSSFTIKGYDVDTVQGKRFVLVTVSKGLFRAKVNRFFGGQGTNFGVESSVSVAGVKGTDFVVMYTDEGVKVLCLYGIVTVKSSDPKIAGEVELAGGRMTDIKQGQPPAEAAAITDEELKSIVEETEMSAKAVKEEPVVEEVVEPALQEQVDNLCLKCHAGVGDKMAAYKFKHPDAKKSCAVCHVQSKGKPIEIKAESQAETGLLVLEVKEALFYDVTLTANDAVSGRTSTVSVSVNPGTALDSVNNDGLAPVISNVRVSEMAAGMLFTAVVEWDTDKPARSKINYGKTDKFGTIAKNTGGEVVYLTRHMVKLDKLKPGDTYYMVAESEDVFGNKSVSEAVKFSVDKPFASDKALATESAAALELSEVGLLNAGIKIVLRWKANARVGVSALVVESDVKFEDKPHYPGFRVGADIGIDACNACHGGGSHKQTAHPVGPMNWKTTRKNPNLPYDNAGNITCLTCHPGHGSEFGKMLRAEETPLCNFCHK